MGAPPPRPSPPKPAGSPPIPQYTPSQPLPPKPQMPGALNVAPPAPVQPAVPGLLQPTPLALPAPAPPPQEESWGLDGLDLSAGPAAPAPAPPSRQKSNDWPAPSGVDPAVWAQLPEAMQREILMQRGGDPHADSATAAVPPPRAPRATGADAYRSAKHHEAPAHSTHGVVQIECLARCSLRTLKTKVWKPSVVIIKGHRELLVFRNSSDWAQYRTASIHRGGDIVQAMKAMTPLIKLHIMLSAVHVTDEVKAKEYKTFGPLHHFTLSETSAEGKEKVVAKFASRGARECLDLRGAINAAVRSGGASRSDGGDAVGRYNS